VAAGVAVRVLDVAALTPYAEPVPTEGELATAREGVENYENEKRFKRAVEEGHGTYESYVAPESRVYNLARERAVLRSDYAWLCANLPVGTVFDHLGATCMSAGREMVNRIPRGFWVAVLHVPDPERGYRVERVGVQLLRAMVEPDYVVVPRYSVVVMDDGSQSDTGPA
jgi:hypothetical protein